MYDSVSPIAFPIPFSHFLDLDHGVRFKPTPPTMTMRSPPSDDADLDETTRKYPIHETPQPSQQVRTPRRIVAHYGPLTADHPAFIGSTFNLLVEWDNRRYSTEALETMIDRDILLVLQYSNECSLFDDSRWSSRFPDHIRSQMPRIQVPTPTDASRHDLDHCRAVATAVRKSFEACLDYRADDSCRTLRDGVCEIFVGTLYEEHPVAGFETKFELTFVLPFCRCLGNGLHMLRTYRRVEFCSVQAMLQGPEEEDEKLHRRCTFPIGPRKNTDPRRRNGTSRDTRRLICRFINGHGRL
jgi:hypothetical protein